jgi:lysophospholipase L1-like esterase
MAARRFAFAAGLGVAAAARRLASAAGLGVAAAARRLASAAGLGVAAAALVAGCGGGSSGDHAAGKQANPTANAGARIVFAAPSDGSTLAARRTPGGRLLRRTQVRGTARPGSVVYLNANCRPVRCDARATATAQGRWSAALALTTTPTARFVTIDAAETSERSAPAAVTTVELTAPGVSTGARAGARRSPRAAAPPLPRSLPRDVLVIGDSLAVGMEDALREALPGWRVRFEDRIGRPLAEGMRILAREPDAPAILAMSLFTNDSPSATGALEAAVRATAGRPGGCAVWATIVRPPENGVSYAAANELLGRLAGDPQLALSLQLADWSGAVAQSPSLLAPDGVHGTPTGYRARAALYAGAIRACAGET